MLHPGQTVAIFCALYAALMKLWSDTFEHLLLPLIRILSNERLLCLVYILLHSVFSIVVHNVCFCRLKVDICYASWKRLWLCCWLSCRLWEGWSLYFGIPFRMNYMLCLAIAFDGNSCYWAWDKLLYFGQGQWQIVAVLFWPNLSQLLLCFQLNYCCILAKLYLQFSLQIWVHYCCVF